MEITFRKETASQYTCVSRYTVD